MLVARRSVSGARRRTGAVFTETFPGADGSDWSGQWTNKRVTTGGVVDIQSSRGHLGCGTVAGYQGKAGMMSTASFGDMNLTGDYIVGSTVTECFPMFGFRSSASWSPIHASALNSYWLEFSPFYAQFVLFRRVNDTPTSLSTVVYTFLANDVIHFRIVASGQTLSVRVWKNSETEPTATWQISLDDTSHTSGQLYATLNGGNDGVADHAYFDNITISSGTPPVVPPPPPPPPTSTLTRIGVTWTGVRPAASMDSVVSVHDTQAQHIIAFGAADSSDGGIELNPSPGVYNWAALDPYVQDIIDAGATKPIIILCRCPPRMRPQPPPTFGTQAFFDWQDSAPLPAFRSEWAALCAAVVARYTQVAYFSYWNEMKGYWNLAQNRWDYERYTADYNAVWAACKAVRPTCKIGGPYVILQSGATGTSWSHGPTAVTFPGGSHDSRQLDVMTYFVANATGYDFLSCDGGLENQFGTQIPVDPYQQIQKLWGWWSWVRTLGGAAATCELFNFETYVNQTVNAPWNYSIAQREDLFIELARQTQLNVPNPNVTYLTWFHPLFKPQVINASSDFVWANTESTFRAKVAAWHGTSPLLTLFRSRYPATGAEVSVNPGGVQAAINAATAGTTIRLLPGTYNDSVFDWSGKNGTPTNWIRMVCDPGVVINVNGGNGGQGLSQLKNCSYIAIWGGEWVGVNNVANQYEVAHLMQQNAHSVAVWGGTYHDMGGHFFANLYTHGRWDVCYNRGYRLANWNEAQASAISCIGMTTPPVAAWPDGYQIHVVGNVIDATWTDPSRHPTSYFLDPQFVPSDGNGVIMDRSGGYSGRSLVAHNLVVGCGGRGLHTLEVHNVDMWCNTCLDNSQNLAGSWIGEISITDSSGSHAAWNLAAARPGSNRVGIYQNSAGSTWSDTGFLRGTGGSEANDPSVNANGNVNLTAIGPAAYFVAYQPGVHQAVSITNIAGYRPKLATVSKFTPPADVRAAVAPWPDALGVARPATGDWARGAFEGA